MKKENTLSIRKYAAKCGVSDAAVRKAIKSGRINKGYDKEKKKIIVDRADEEYGFDIVIKKTNEKISKSISQSHLEDLSNVSVVDIQLKADDVEPEARRKTAIIDGQTKLLNLKEKAGELVNKEEVYKELFSFGKEIRMNMLAIPDRIVDEVITLDRNKAHKLMTESITEALEKLTNAN